MIILYIYLNLHNKCHINFYILFFTDIVLPSTAVMIQVLPSGISDSSSDFAVQTTPFFAFAWPFWNFVMDLVIKTSSPIIVFTLVLSFPMRSFFITKGLVKTIRSIVINAKIKSCHLNGSPVLAMKISGIAAIPAHIVVSPIVNASITMQTINIPSHIQELKFIKNSFMFYSIRLNTFLV